jgi:hypothetical protein
MSSWLRVSLLASVLLLPCSSLAVPRQPMAAIQPIVFQTDFDPPGDDAPPDTVGAGSRSPDRCAANDRPTQPLLPTQGYGLTLAAQPTFFVNLPKTSAQQVVLTIEDEAHTVHDRAFFPLPEQPGLASFQIPDPPLAIGKNYRVSLILVCGDSVQPDDPVFSSWVQRVEKTAEVDRQLQSMTPLEQAQWYAERGYWYDLIPVLTRMYETDPAAWQEFLSTQGMEPF